MSDQVVDSAARPVPLQSILPVLTAAAVFALLGVMGAGLLCDPDSYWHVVVGRWTLETGTVPRVDTFSHTVAGTHWIAKEWLSQILYAQAYAWGGWSGVVMLAALAAAGALALLGRFLLGSLGPAPALALVLAAFALIAPHLSARPHVLALPVMVAWMGGLVRSLDRCQSPPLWLLAVMSLWANLHGGFTLGLAMLGPATLEALWAAPRAERRATFMRWLGFGVLALLAACVTPYGPESILVTYRILGLGEALAIINEWRPPDFSRLGGFEIALLAAIGFALHRGLTLPPVRILVVLGLLHLALAHGRNTALFGLLVPLFVAAPLARQCGAWGERRPNFDPRLAAAAATLLFATGVSGAILGRPQPHPAMTPAAAVDAVQRLNPGPLLNDYNFGGYLLWRGVAPFIDGRTELYGGAFVARHHRAVMLQDLPGFLDLLETYRIGATLLPPKAPAVALLDRLPDWRRVYSDDIAVVHVRRRP